MSVQDIKAVTAETRQAWRQMYAATEDLNKYLTKAKASNLNLSSLKNLKRTAEEAKKTADTATKTASKFKEVAEKAKKITDFLQKGLFKQVNPKLGAAVSAGGQLAQAAFTTFLVLKQGEIQGYQLQTDDYNRSGIQDAFTRSINNGIQIKGLQKQIEATNKKVADTIDKTYAEVGGAVQNATKARELANNALYETRAGRTKLEAQVATARKQANDALYETRIGRQKLEAQIASTQASIQSKITQSFNNLAQGFQQQINTTITGIQKALISANAQNTKISAEVNSQKSAISLLQASNNALNAKVNAIKQLPTIDVNAIVANAKAAVANEVSNLKGQINNLSAQLSSSQNIVSVLTGAISSTANAVNQVDKKADAAMAEAKNKGMPNLTPLQKQLDEKFNNFVAENNKALQVRDLQQSNLSKEFDQKLKDFERQSTLTADQRFTEFQQQNQRDLQKISKSVSQTTKDIEQLEKQVKEQDKVNEQGNKQLKEITSKIDSLIPAVAGIPLVVGRAADKVIAATPTIPDIEKAATTGVCRSTQPGGCMSNALDNQTNNINNNANQNQNNLLDKLNLAGQGIDLGVLTIINDKLGDKIPGGIGGFLQKGFKWLNLDRITNMITLWVTIHNAAMLSAQVGDTLLSVIENGLTIFGVKDADGTAIDLNEYFGKQVEGILKSVLGESNYTQMTLQWKRASAIYRSAANVANSVTGLTNSVINGLEVVGSQVAKIGNALRWWGAIGEKAYETFNPSPNFKAGGLLDKINNLDDAANFVLQVSQVPIDVTQAYTEAVNANTEFAKAIKEETKKGIVISEPEKTKQAAEDSKAASAATPWSRSDIFSAND